MFLRNWWYGTPKQAVEVPVLAAATPSTEPQCHPLDEFNRKIEKDREKIKALIANWEAYKKQVMLDVATSLPGGEHHFECDVEKHNEVKSVFTLIAEKIRSYFQSVSANLQAQLDHEVGNDGHIKVLEAHILKLCEVAVDASRSERERCDAKIHICNASIVVLNELHYLASGFLEEILSAVSMEQREEQAVRTALLLITTLLSGFIGTTLPFIEFDCKDRYEQVLNKSISNQETGYGMTEAEVEDVLEKARRVVMDGGYTAALRRAGGSVTAPKEKMVENPIDAAPEQLRSL